MLSKMVRVGTQYPEKGLIIFELIEVFEQTSILENSERTKTLEPLLPLSTFLLEIYLFYHFNYVYVYAYLCVSMCA